MTQDECHRWSLYLSGGDGDDTIEIADDGITGTIDGGDGTDTLVLRTPLPGDYTGAIAFQNIEVLDITAVTRLTHQT